jgi:hypothetical protein
MLAHKGTDAIALRAQVGVHAQFPARPDQADEDHVSTLICNQKYHSALNQKDI